MKAIITCFIAVLLLSCQVQSQTWTHRNIANQGFNAYEGSQLPHMFSTVIWATNPTDLADPLTVVTQNTYDTLLPENLFGTTDKIYYATSLFDFDFRTAASQRYLSVPNLVVNSGRTGFTLTVNYFEKLLGSTAATLYTNLGISVIIVGSSFSGEPGYVESSYVYPRNGVLQDVDYSLVAPITETYAQFDFANNESPSPFNYVPGTEFAGRCGMIRGTATSNKIIELSGCGYFNFYTYVTGFVIQEDNVIGSRNLDASAVVLTNVRQGSTGNFMAGPPVIDPLGGEDYIFQRDGADDSVGLWIYYSTMTNTLGNLGFPVAGPVSLTGPPTAGAYQTLKLQLSFVFVGIRSFTENVNSILDYPVQHLFRQDDFVHVAEETRADPAVPAVPALLPQYFASAQPAGSITLRSLMTRNFFDSTGPVVKAASVTYIDTVDAGFGSAFCGLKSIALEDTYTINIQRLDEQAGNVHAISVASHPNTRFRFQCAYFRRRRICDGTPTALAPLPGTSGYSFVGSNVVVGVSATVLNTFAPPAVSGFDFEINQNAIGILTTAQITTIYNRAITEATVFRVTLEFTIGGLGAAPYSEGLTITAFGQVIVSETFSAVADYDALAAPGGLTYALQRYVYSSDKTKNTIVIKYSAAGNYRIDNIRIAVERYGNQIDGIECATNCPSRTGFIAGIDPTTAPPSCIYCAESTNREPDFLTGCACKKNFQEVSGVCVLCSTGITNCGDCNGLDCTECTQNSDPIRHPITGKITQCRCRTGFFSSGGKCLACPFGCAQCTSLTSCTVCQASTNAAGVVTRQLPTCSCKRGFFENGGDFICPSCSPRCDACANTADECTECRVFNNFLLKDNTCECRSGFYELNTGTTVTCQQCDGKCLTCATSSLYCVTCSADDFRELAGRPDGTQRCDCIDGYTELADTCVDKTCGNVDPNCQTCAFNPITLRSECLSCGANRYIVNGKCACKVGYYEVGSVCQKCAPGCQTCGIVASQLRCFTCAERARNNDDGSCTCPTGTVVVEASDSLFCQTCSNNCASCVGVPDHCTACAPGFTLQANKCVCGLGTYLATSNTKCLPCMDNCNVCKRTDFGTLECITCATDFVYNGIQCALSCPNGKYNGGSNCLDCPSECVSCLSNSLCLSCASGYYLFAGSCRKTCPIGTLAVGQECLACLSPCASCTKEATSCDSCVKGYLLFNGKCLKDCPPSTYFGDSSCLACNPRCLTCSGTSTNCVSCASTQYLFNNNCYDVCPAAIVGGICTDNCPSGKYYENSRCLNCDSKCLTCKGSASNCTACASSFISYGGACLDKCPTGTFENNKACVRCDASCATCSESSIKCTSCTSGYVKEGNYCVQKCQDGFYKDVSGVCKQCGVGCKTCTSSSSCSQCFDTTLSPSNGKCVKLCPAGSLSDGTKCVCTFGVLHENVCISTCPQGYYASNRECTLCQYPCKTCLGTGNTCVSCIDGFSFDSATKKCLRTNKCPYGQVQKGSGCINYCPGALVLHKDSCIFECPVGYENNGYNGCVSKSTGSVCPAGKYQYLSTCVDNCVAGYFANTLNGVCTRCSTGCDLCLNLDFCVKCASDYIFENGGCVKKIACATGTIQFEGKCYPGCPAGTGLSGLSCAVACEAGTYFWNPFCYASCPTNLHTKYACVAECPAGYTRSGNLCTIA